jgi:hypothetical protein
MDDIRDRYLGTDNSEEVVTNTGTPWAPQERADAAREDDDDIDADILGADEVIDIPVREVRSEVLQSPMIAANGDRLPQIAATAGNFIDMLEDGQFSADINNQLQEMAAAMEDIAQFNGGKSKGKLVITIDLTKEDSVFKIASAFKATKPELPRPKSVLWTTDRNEFSRFPPGQNQLFGLRPATKAGQG